MKPRLYVTSLFRDKGEPLRRFSQYDPELLEVALASEGSQRDGIKLIVANLFGVPFKDVSWSLVRFSVLPVYGDDDSVDPTI